MNGVKTGKIVEMPFPEDYIQSTWEDIRCENRHLAAFFMFFPFVKVLGKQHSIVQIDIWHNGIFYVCNIGLQGKHINGFSVFKKIGWLYWMQQKHIIIKINKVFRQIFYPVEIPLNGMRVKGGEIFFGNKIFV